MLIHQEDNFINRLIEGMRQIRKEHLMRSSERFSSLVDKDLNQLVTDMDVAVEKALVKLGRSLLPDSDFLTEEKTTDQESNSEYRWIIDPIDGTTNFVHAVPVYAMSVALQYQGRTVLGVVYEISRDEIFYANEEGAYLNGQVIHVTSNETFEDSLIATGFPYYDFDRTTKYLKVLEFCMKHTRGVRRLGSAAVDLAYVACGRFDAFFEYSLSPWDVAAGAYIVQQAGGKVTDFKGGEDFIFGKEIIAGQENILDHLGEEIKRHF